jgi:hypothetical protein
MRTPVRFSAARMSALLIGLAATAPGIAAPAPKAQLVHCEEGACLRISGHRRHMSVAVRAAGRDLPVEGGRSWRATLPLAQARSLADVAGDRMTVVLADPQTGTESEEAVTLPPGALGKHIELAELIVRAH